MQNRWLRELLWSVLGVWGVYVALLGNVHWLKARAGVGSDTGTVIDVLAWMAAIAAASVVAGWLSRGMEGDPVGFQWPSALPPLALVGAVLLQTQNEIVSDGFTAVFGYCAVPALVWVIAAGVSFGRRIDARKTAAARMWVVLAILLVSVGCLWLVMAPAEAFFMRLYG